MRGLRLLLLAALMVPPAGGALADDWTAVKLRGAVVQMVDGGWQPLQRGDVVPDDRLVKTQSGRVTLVRGAETIELGPNTQIQILDKGGRRPFTTVREHFGTVSVEAEVKQVQHFAVQTPFLVAVVKGTRFSVRSGGTRSDVTVTRGAVQVRDGDGDDELVFAGQTAKAAADAPIQVRGVALNRPDAKGGETAKADLKANKDVEEEGKSAKESKEDKKDKSDEGSKEEKSEKGSKEEKSDKPAKEDKDSGSTSGGKDKDKD